MHEYGTTQEQLAHVALSAREWARRNPLAFKRDKLTLDDVLGARVIAPPLTAADCCLVTDGAAAVVMVRADRAPDHRATPAYLLGAGLALDGTNPALRADLTGTVATRSGAAAYAMAGTSAAEIDALQLYDAFTINVVLFLEDLGFCPKGEGGPFVAEGTIAPGGA